MLQDLKLERPLVFFDIESTGLTPQRDRIVQIAIVKIFPDGKIEEASRKLNPEMPIPPAATAIHGITDADVAGSKTFQQIAEKLYNYIDNCDLAGYNITGFDIPMLEAEFKRAGINFSVDKCKIVDAYSIFCKLYPRTLTAAHQFFCGTEFKEAHDALADTKATVRVFFGQLQKHQELPRTVAELADFSNLAGADAVDRTRRFKWNNDEVVINFGKNIGRTLRDIAANDPGFLRWIIKGDFTDEVKEIANNALLGVFPTRGNATNGSSK